MRRSRISPSWIAACLLACVRAEGAAVQEPAPAASETPAAVSPAPAEPYAASLPEMRAGVPGTWDLSRDGTNRRCVLTLAAEAGEAGQTVRFPAGCRRSLPVMGGIAGWLFADGVVRLVDRNVRPVLLFARRPDQRSLIARVETGEVYSLVPLEIAAMRSAAAEPIAAMSAVPPDEAKPAAASVDAPVGPGPAPGLYALDRYRDRDVCRLDLGGGPGAPVRLAAGCRDGGIEVFDPVSWRYAKGRLTLSAKRGHTVNLVPAGDGTWRRDPETGTTFVLRRIEP
ncbi:AprI/Inh family metalloprotease inhibitor [uncultured Methylobacterium sp.]|uniref:AprI/Inh family metalloprotease inhibitor n=1 Tax=uncultured Methylobacterium sp. TaxID=157278 RepID=UPI0035CC2A68